MVSIWQESSRPSSYFTTELNRGRSQQAPQHLARPERYVLFSSERLYMQHNRQVEKTQSEYCDRALAAASSILATCKMGNDDGGTRRPRPRKWFRFSGDDLCTDDSVPCCCYLGLPSISKRGCHPPGTMQDVSGTWEVIWKRGTTRLVQSAWQTSTEEDEHISISQVGICWAYARPEWQAMVESEQM